MTDIQCLVGMLVVILVIMFPDDFIKILRALRGDYKDE